MINKIKRYKIVSLFFRLINPGYGYCHICGLPWNHCKEKTVWYNSGTGYFATCEYCWSNSGLDQIEKTFLKFHNLNVKEGLWIDYDFDYLMFRVKQ